MVELLFFFLPLYLVHLLEVSKFLFDLIRLIFTLATSHINTPDSRMKSWVVPSLEWAYYIIGPFNYWAIKQVSLSGS